jgi:5'-nucleotidase
MKFLITNDDGIEAAGLNALLEAAQNFGEVTIVAPAAPQSGVSHAVTWHEGVRIEPRGERRFAIHGTPADCIRLGLLHLVPDANWVLSGINHGANLGADIYYSGTVAAVREAILHGWPGIAFSHYRKGADFDWGRAMRWITPLLRELLDRPIEPGLFYNVNLPLLPAGTPDPEVIWCPLDPKPLPLNYRHEEETALRQSAAHSIARRNTFFAFSRSGGQPRCRARNAHRAEAKPIDRKIATDRKRFAHDRFRRCHRKSR